MNRLLKLFLITAASVFAIASARAEPDQPTQTLFKNLMTATLSNNYDSFISECDDAMKSAMTKPLLEGVSKQIEPRARQGYNAQYLGELKQRGFKVHLWRLSFKDAGDDILATLSVKDGKVGGFYLH